MIQEDGNWHVQSVFCICHREEGFITEELIEQSNRRALLAKFSAIEAHVQSGFPVSSRVNLV